MNQIRIAHFADTHLGYRAIPTKHATGPGIIEDEVAGDTNQRTLDVRQAFGRAYGEIIVEHVRRPIDLVIHAGDVFNHPNTRPAEQMAVIAAIRAIDTLGIDQVWIGGNHEIGISRLGFFDVLRRVFADQPRVRIWNERCPHTTLTDSGIQIDGFPHGAVRWMNADNDREHRDPGAIARIAVAHGEVTTAGAILQGNEAALFDETYDYIGLGHIHAFSKKVTAAGPAVMSGPTERYGWRDRNAEPGFVIATLTGADDGTWHVDADHRTIPTRRLIDLGTIETSIGDAPLVAISEIGNRIVDAHVESAAYERIDSTDAAIWRVNIVGPTADQAASWRARIAAHFADIVWHLQIDITPPATVWRDKSIHLAETTGIDLGRLFEQFITENADTIADDYAARFQSLGLRALELAASEQIETGE